MTATSLSSSLSPCLFHSVTAIIQVIFFLGGFGSAAGLASLEASWFSSTVSIHDDSNQRCRWQTQDICCVCFQHPLRIPSSYRRNKIGLLTTWKCDLQNFDQIKTLFSYIFISNSGCVRGVSNSCACHSGPGLHLMSTPPYAHEWSSAEILWNHRTTLSISWAIYLKLSSTKTSWLYNL